MNLDELHKLALRARDGGPADLAALRAELKPDTLSRLIIEIGAARYLAVCVDEWLADKPEGQKKTTVALYSFRASKSLPQPRDPS